MEDCVGTFHTYVRPWKSIFQMILGGVLAALLILKLVLLMIPLSLGPLSDLEAIPPLKLVGSVLAYSAGIELAYMLFTPGPDEAVEPLILGLSATALVVVSKEPFGSQGLVEVVGLALAIGFLFWVRARFVEAPVVSERRAEEVRGETPS